MIWSKLYDYQRSAVEWMVGKDGAGLFGEQGIGKTWILGGLLEVVCMSDPSSFCALIVCPKSNVDSTWNTLLITELEFLFVARDWESYKNAAYPKVLLVHYEALPKISNRVVKRKWTVVAYDECQRLKQRSSKTSRIAARFSDVRYRIGLSGTPIEQKAIDLWAQFRFFAPWVFGKRWGNFESEFTVPTGWMGKQRKMRKGKQKKFLRLIKDWTLRITKKDVLDLPKLTFVRAPVMLKGDQARLYDAMRDELIAEHGDSVTTAGFEVTRLVKLQQICCGFIKDDAGEIVFLGNSKVRKVKSILRRHDSPVVIFCNHKQDVKTLHASLKGAYRCDVIQGGTTGREDIVNRFQRGEIDVLLCQIKAGGVGIDLYRSCTAIFYSISWSYIDFHQAVARIHRNGQTRPVKVFLIFAKNTVDEDIYTAIMNKQAVSTSILNTLKETRMAKKKTVKKTVKKTKKATPKPTPAPTPRGKYGVSDLAELLEIEPHSVRYRLRTREIPRTGKAYSWDSKAELKEVAKKITLE